MRRTWMTSFKRSQRLVLSVLILGYIVAVLLISGLAQAKPVVGETKDTAPAHEAAPGSSKVIYGFKAGFRTEIRR